MILLPENSDMKMLPSESMRRPAGCRFPWPGGGEAASNFLIQSPVFEKTEIPCVLSAIRMLPCISTQIPYGLLNASVVALPAPSVALNWGPIIKTDFPVPSITWIRSELNSQMTKFPSLSGTIPTSPPGLPGDPFPRPDPPASNWNCRINFPEEVKTYPYMLGPKLIKLEESSNLDSLVSLVLTNENVTIFIDENPIRTVEDTRRRSKA